MASTLRCSWQTTRTRAIRSARGCRDGAAPPATGDLHPQAGCPHLLAAYDLNRDRLYGHVKAIKGRTQFLAFSRYLRGLYSPDVRVAIICDNLSPHLSTKKDSRVGDWAASANVEIAYAPTYSSWRNRIEAQFTALRYFALDGTDHASHKQQGTMIRRYIIWRNKHAADEHLREVVAKANVA